MEPLKWSGETPEIPFSLELDPWLMESDWVIPVPSPFELRGSVLTASLDPDGWSWFRPADHPWLASELGHVARGMKGREEAETPSLATQEAALDFANRYGLTSPWSEEALEQAGVFEPFEGPPVAAPTSDLLVDAWDVLMVLTELAKEPPEELTADVIFRGASKHTAEFFRGAQELLKPWVEFKLDDAYQLSLRVTVAFPGHHISISDLARLQILADVLAGRSARQCNRRDCGKLFIWSQGRAGAPLRRTGMKGPSPEFCSYSHAQAERHARRVERGDD